MSNCKMQDQAILNELKQRYFTIGEVAEVCELKPHVLRYWEKEFKTLNPSKRRGNRRYYRKEDIRVVLAIKSLLYREGYTIAGARTRLPEVLKTDSTDEVFVPITQVEQTDALVATTSPVSVNSIETPNFSSTHIAEVRQELQELLAFMRGGEQHRSRHDRNLS